MNRKNSIFVVSFIMILVLIAPGCGRQKGSEKTLRPIKYVRVYKDTGAKIKVYSGVSQSTTESHLAFRVSGTIKELLIKIGDAVKKGQVLAKLDATDYETRLREIKAKYTNAKAELNRYRQLYESESTTKQELDQAQANYDMAKSQYELSEKELSYTVLEAPADGLIAKVDAEVHETVSSGQTICVLESGGKLEVEVGLPEFLIGKVKKGKKVTIRFETIKNESFDGIVTEVGIRIDEKTATFPVTIELAEEDERLRTGMVADVEFIFEGAREKASHAMMVPAQSVLEDPSGSKFVWIYSDGVVRQRRVTVGDISGDDIEIEFGLENGEIVATAGVHYLKEGQKVKLME